MANQNPTGDPQREAAIFPDRLTRHAEAQIKKRCIRAELIDYLTEYGHCKAKRSRHGSRRNSPWMRRSSVESYSFTSKAWARFVSDHPDLAKRYPRSRDVYAVVSEGCVITAAYCPAPRHKRR